MTERTIIGETRDELTRREPARRPAHRPAALALLLFALWSAGGCGGATTRPFVGGPYALAQEDLFSRVGRIARGHGYEVAEEDAASGRLEVQAHTTGSRGQTATFVIQCYAPGWVQVTAQGAGAVRRERDQMRMSGALFEEMRELSVALVAELGTVSP